jgi:hypothetical protein
VLITLFDGASFIYFPLPVGPHNLDVYWEVLEPPEYIYIYSPKFYRREDGEDNQLMQIKNT